MELTSPRDGNDLCKTIITMLGKVLENGSVIDGVIAESEIQRDGF